MVARRFYVPRKVLSFVNIKSFHFLGALLLCFYTYYNINFETLQILTAVEGWMMAAEGRSKKFNQKIKPYVVLQYLLKYSD